MDVEHQIKIWLDIISCLDSGSQYPDVNTVKTEISNYFDQLYQNPHLKTSLNMSNDMNVDVYKVNIYNMKQQFLEIQKNIEILEAEVVLQQNQLEEDGNETDSSELKRYDCESVSNLITSWMENVQYIQKKLFKSNESNHEFKQLNEDLTRTVVSLHQSCKTVSEYISALQAIKTGTMKILSAVEPNK